MTDLFKAKQEHLERYLGGGAMPDQFVSEPLPQRPQGKIVSFPGFGSAATAAAPARSQRFRAVAFDLDGVLINSTSCHRAAFEKVFLRFGITDFDYSIYAGWRTADTVEDVLRRHGCTPDAETVAQVAREKSRLAREMLSASKPIADGCAAVLQELATRYRLALASSGSRESVEAFLHLTGSRARFGSILSGNDVSNAKPHPELYLRTFENLGVECSDCLVVEDAVAGVRAATAAGAVVVGITGTCLEEELLQAGAAHVIRDLRELLPLLSRSADSFTEEFLVSRGAFDVADPRIDPSCWTAVIPAAGRGSRLGYHRAKILYPILGRPILDWLLDFLAPNCSSLIFVLSPEAAADVTAELDARIPGRFKIVVQEAASGMGAAVELAAPHVHTSHVAVVWGDQVALRREAVEGCMRLHQGSQQPDVTCPTVLRDHPYIHFDRDTQGRVAGLRQAREGDAMPDRGESDTGFFCFRTAALRHLLDTLRHSALPVGRLTHEFNLLPVIPLATSYGSVLTPQLMQFEETVGVNSKEDAAVVEQFLRRSHVCSES